MNPTSEMAKEILEDLITIERTLWENNAEIYHDRYSPADLAEISPAYMRIHDGRRTSSSMRE